MNNGDFQYKNLEFLRPRKDLNAIQHRSIRYRIIGTESKKFGTNWYQIF